MDLMFPFLGMALDMVDALATAVALVAIWRTWLFPRPAPVPALAPAAAAVATAADLERFLAAVRRHQLGRRAAAPPAPGAMIIAGPRGSAAPSGPARTRAAQGAAPSAPAVARPRSRLGSHP